VDQLDLGRVYVAGEDGKVRVFRLPEHGLEEDCAQTECILSTSSMERISLIKPHPTAKDIVLTISDDMNKPCARVWYVGKVVDPVKPSNEVPLPSGAISSASWSLDGSYLAIANKAKTLYVMDPRRGDDQLHWSQGSTHDSARAVQVTWADDRSHLLTSGFSSTGVREVKFYGVNHGQRVVECLAQISFDNSPAAFFMHYDPDTSIGFCWSKGDRTTYLIELIETTTTPDATKSTYKFDRLTPFVHSTIQLGYSFFIKQVLDVKAVEVAKALRLTGNQVQVVSFKVPRNRTEFFQDDVFCDTRDLLNPTFKDGQDWLLLAQSSSQDHRDQIPNPPPSSKVNLQPPGMSKLSEAPLTKVQSNQKSLIAKGPQLTDSQKQDQYLDKLFRSAKRDDHPAVSTDHRGHAGSQEQQQEEEEEVVGRSRVGAPPDDDW